jgi:protein-arginine kinase activator protein McsA
MGKNKNKISVNQQSPPQVEDTVQKEEIKKKISALRTELQKALRLNSPVVGQIRDQIRYLENVILPAKKNPFSSEDFVSKKETENMISH